jgi:hypothetical protein
MNVFQRALAELLSLLRPVILAPQDASLRRALVEAMEIEPGTAGAPSIPASAITRIEAVLQKQDPELLDFLDAGEAVLEIIKAIRDFVATGSSGSAALEKAFKAGLSSLTVRWLRFHQPIAYCALRVLRVIESSVTSHWQEDVHFERIGKLITNTHEYFATYFPLQTEDDAKETSDVVFRPLGALASYVQSRSTRPPRWPIAPSYGWDSPPAANAPIGESIAKRTLAIGISHHDPATNADLSLLTGLAFVPAVHDGPGMVLSFLGSTVTVPFRDGWHLEAGLGGGQPLTLKWRFGDSLSVVGPTATELSLSVSRTPDTARKPLTLPLTANTRIEIGDIDFELDIDAREIDARVTIHDAAVIVGKDSADSFSGSKMPGAGVRGDFDLTIGISSVRGVYLGGTAGISATIPIDKDIGPLHVGTLRIEVRPDSAGAIRVGAGLELSLEVGPVLAVIEGIGVRLDVSFPETGGNLGAVDIQPRFQWPRGIGVTVDAGAVTGGGYIYFDPDNGRYAGVLQLEMKSFSIKAIGLLDTKLPGGKPGFSFLIIVAAEFSPISLVMGFTLNGVGGLAGLHRTITVDALQAGVRNHAVDDILFPEDPVKNAPRIISDLQRFFPPVQGRYIFGPMLLIGWGAPTLITIELGIIIELPAPVRILLLGQVNCTLPDPAAPLIELHVDILGVLDFGAKLFALDGVIHDSLIGPFAIYGDFAVRVRWGEQSTFALSVGGFHPRFSPPDGFPSLRRITIALAEGDNPRVTMASYFALTSNSLQFGSRAELYASAGKFNISGWISFDVLIIFRPFSLTASLSAGFALRRGSRYLAGVHVEATLTGPGPWHVWGEASLTILCWDVSVDFDLTIGRHVPQALPPTNIWASLKPAMEETNNWSAILPPGVARVVSVTAPSNFSGPVLDPAGRISMIQRIAPLNRVNTRFADGTPTPPLRFELDFVIVELHGLLDLPLSTFPPSTVVHELFPPAQVEQMSDDEKLSRPSFEKMVAGFSLDDMVELPPPVGFSPVHRTIVIDSPVLSHDGAAYPLTSGVLEAVARASAAASGGMHASSSDAYVKPGAPLVRLADETYVIASAAELKARADLATPGTKSTVVAALRDYIAIHPEERGKLIVIPEEEAA